ncbi:forespore capture DNA-binding protein RefZ [Aneurinibacillus uraniidurans]|uniref:forespore capture DNA-binding protein RefZ n=1 Tax=Aneurinibacillus uraniidurans TaxID=2966586 RepID=UPI002349783A|nr:forespore capture DNA-binding protein RefZ [Aneurinibacillus sp. B1]WCN37036.1 forespore capture DNA-binding protein RefZ [Aneurinibacillus sp. B1]
MKRSPKHTKQKIVDAAAALFDSQGFDRTTVRQIACAADVNVALISYYFKHKQGLLEVIMMDYYELLFARLDTCKACDEQGGANVQLYRMIEVHIRFQSEMSQTTRLIQRELSVESMLGREVMSTYLTRLKHYFVSVLEEGMETGEFKLIDVDHVIIYLFAIAGFPYTYPQIVREVFYLEPLEESFIQQTIQHVHTVVRQILTPAVTS